MMKLIILKEIVLFKFILGIINMEIVCTMNIYIFIILG